MRTKIIRLASLGSAVALWLTAAPVLLAPAAEAAITTTLTGAQATTALLNAVASTERRVLRDGTRQSSATGGVEQTAPGWSRWRTVVRVDPGRRTISEQIDIDGSRYVPAVYYVDACDPGSGGNDESHYRFVTKAGTGTWERLKPTPNERAGLKLLKRSKVRWEFTKRSKVTVKGQYRLSGWGGDVKQNLLESYRLTGGTTATTATGRHLTFTYAEKDGSDTGTIALDVDSQGALVSYFALEDADGSVPPQTWRTTWNATYGKQSVKTPAKSTAVASKTLYRGCTAALTKSEPRRLAKSAATQANDWVKETGRKLTVKRLRTYLHAGDAGADYGLNLKVTNIRSGMKIVGRHKLLSRPYVWTVFVRNGKAVAHKVR